MRSSDSGPDAAQEPAGAAETTSEAAEQQGQTSAGADATAALFRGWLAGHNAELAALAKAEQEEAEANVSPAVQLNWSRLQAAALPQKRMSACR